MKANAKPNVGFLPLYKIQYPSSRYRVFQFLEPLRQQGFTCTVLEAPQRNPAKRLLYLPQLWQLARTQDILYVQKRMLPQPILSTLQRLNPRLVFDLDDAIFLYPTSKPHVDAMLRSAALVIAGNAYLAEYAQSLNSHVLIIPTVVDTNIYRPLNGLRHPGDDRIIVGWIGQNPNRGDLAPLLPVLDYLAERYGEQVVLRIVSDQPLEAEMHLRQDFIPWNLESALPALQSFDIGIMPLEDTDWNRGKCGFKLIQYMAVGAAAVASPVGSNHDILVDEQTGYFADTTTAWVEALSNLIENAATRAQFAAAGRRRCMEIYSIQAVLPSLITALQDIAEVH